MKTELVRWLSIGSPVRLVYTSFSAGEGGRVATEAKTPDGSWRHLTNLHVAREPPEVIDEVLTDEVVDQYTGDYMVADTELDCAIGSGNIYDESETETTTVVKNVWIDEDGDTQVDIHDRIPYEHYHGGAESGDVGEHRTVTKAELIQRIGAGELELLEGDPREDDE